MARRGRSALWNDRTNRLRLPWRLVATVTILTLLGIAVGGLAPNLRDALAVGVDFITPRPTVRAATVNIVFVVSQITIYAGTVYLAGRFIDRRWFRDFGLRIDRNWWVNLGFGLALGAILMTGIFLVELALGWIVITGTFRSPRGAVAFWPWFTWAIAIFITIGVTEELLTRGYLLTNIAEGCLWFERIGPNRAVWLAIGGSSLFFALGHALNPNADFMSTAGIFIAGVMLATGYVLTGELALPIGIHITWNFFQGPVFGFPVSGLEFGAAIFAVEQRGPVLVTGGPFGPEAGILGVGASLVAIVVIAIWANWHSGELRFDPRVTSPELRVEQSE